jgi:hypothetical protein
MRLSNGTPVQFWLNGQETFNEKVVPGVQQTNFNQIFRPEDNVVIQFTDTLLFGYQLNILDVNGDILQTLPFTITPIEDNYVYSLSFTFDDYSITGLVTLTISYFVYELSGGVNGLLGVVSGTAINTETFLLSGGVDGLMGSGEGDIQNGSVITISNSSTDLVITNVVVTGQTLYIDSGAFPIATSEGVSARIKSQGNFQVVVTLTTPSPGTYNLVIDGSCYDIESSGSYIYESVPFSASAPVVIVTSDGACS